MSVFILSFVYSESDHTDVKLSFAIDANHATQKTGDTSGCVFQICSSDLSAYDQDNFGPEDIHCPDKL